MRAAFYCAPECIEVRDVSAVHVTDGDVLIDVEACGVCGSDVASFAYGHYVEAGQVMGHEVCGLVADVGSALAGISIGDRVVVRPMRSCGTCAYCIDGQTHLCAGTAGRSLGYGLPGGYADQVLVTDAVIGLDVRIVPLTLEPQNAMWAEPLAVAIHAVGICGVGPAEPMVVIGGGSVGLCVAAAGLCINTGCVTVVEPRADRRAAAARLGAETADGSTDTPYRDAAHVIDASGSVRALTEAMAAMRAGGRMVLVGLGDAYVPWSSGRVDVVGSFAYTDVDFARSVDLLVGEDVQLGELVTHVFALDDTALAIAASRGDPTVVKAAVMPIRPRSLEKNT